MADITQSIQAARDAGYKDDEIAKFLKQKGIDSSVVKKVPNKLESTLRGAGLGGLYDVGKQGVGFGQMAIGGITQNPQMQQEGYQNISEAQQKFGFADPRSQGNQFDPKQYATQTAKDAAGLAPWLAGGSGAAPLINQVVTGASRGVLNRLAQDKVTPGEVVGGAVGGGIAEPAFNTLFKILPYLTKGGAANKTNQAVESATKEGKGMKFDELTAMAKKKVQEKLGWTPEVRDAFNNTIVEKTPASIEPGAGNFDPQQMLDWRRQIGARQGSGIFQALQKGGDIQGKVDSEIRNVISENVHKLAPDSKTADMLYSFYKKGGPLFSGDIPTKVVKLGGIAAAGKALPYLLQRALSGMVGELK